MITTQNRAFIEAEQYSQFILENLDDGLLPDGLYRNVTDFPNGETLNIKTVGATTIQEVSEDTPINYSSIDTGNVTLSITDYIGDAWYITDVMRQDGAQVDQLAAMRGMESTRAIQEYFETRWLETLVRGQDNASANNINGYAHRIVSSATDNLITFDHFVDMNVAFKKANAPNAGRIAIVDPVVTATLEKNLSFFSRVDHNPRFQGLLEEGFARDHKFVMNILGWDIWESNRLPTTTADGTDFSDGTTTLASGSGVANIFMCVADDQTKPGMAAWREMPGVEGERNKDRGRDEFITRARFGTGVQRFDTLGVVVTSNSNY